VHAGKTEKSAKLDFRCTEAVAPKWRDRITPGFRW